MNRSLPFFMTVCRCDQEGCASYCLHCLNWRWQEQHSSSAAPSLQFFLCVNLTTCRRSCQNREEKEKNKNAFGRDLVRYPRCCVRYLWYITQAIFMPDIHFCSPCQVVWTTIWHKYIHENTPYEALSGCAVPGIYTIHQALLSRRQASRVLDLEN